MAQVQAPSESGAAAPVTLPIDFQFSYVKFVPNSSGQVEMYKCSAFHPAARTQLSDFSHDTCLSLIPNAVKSETTLSSCFDFAQSEDIQTLLLKMGLENPVKNPNGVNVMTGYVPIITPVFSLISIVSGSSSLVASLYLSDITGAIQSQKDLKEVLMGINTDDWSTTIIGISSDVTVAPQMSTHILTYDPSSKVDRLFGFVTDQYSEEKYIREFRSVFTTTTQYQRNSDQTVVNLKLDTSCKM